VRRNRRRRGARGGWLPIWGVLIAGPAEAQQPLDAFVDAVSRSSLDVQTAALRLGEARALRAGARAAWVPRVSADATYTRNQLEVAVTLPGEDGEPISAVISAQDQLDAVVRADWALLDASAVAEVRSADAQVDAALLEAEDTHRTVLRAVIAAWHQLAAARHVVEAAERSLDAAANNLAVVASQVQAGLAAPLDRDRAEADRARAAQQLAEAQLEAMLAAQQITLLTGLEPAEGPSTLPVDLSEPEPLEAFSTVGADHPRVRAADARRVAARRAARSSALSLTPAVSAFAQERFTNAAGFGPDALWSAGVAARWELDGGRAARAVEADRAAARADVAVRRAQREIEAELREAWHRVRASRARLEAAEAEEQARLRAADVARTRFTAGNGSALELSVAERDRFDAEVARIRALAALRTDQLTLRVIAGQPLPSSEVTP